MEVISQAMKMNFASKQTELSEKGRKVAFERLCNSTFADRRKGGRPPVEYKGDIEFIQFGSSTFGLASETSDLDVCLKPGPNVFPPSFSPKAILSRFSPHHQIRIKKRIFNARVPLLQMETEYGFQIVKIDLSVLSEDQEIDQLKKGPYVKHICELDPLDRISVFLFTVKEWAKYFYICDAVRGTLNSYTWLMIGIFSLKKKWGENFEIPKDVNIADMLSIFFDTFLEFDPCEQFIDLETASFLDKDKTNEAHTSQRLLVSGVFETDKFLGRPCRADGAERIMKCFIASASWIVNIRERTLRKGVSLDQIFYSIFSHKCFDKNSEKVSIEQLDIQQNDDDGWGDYLDKLVNK